jgi:hypothetical protein
MIDPKLFKKSVVVLLVVMLLMIPGLAAGQNESDEDPIPEIIIEIDGGENGQGLFDTTSIYFWILIVLLLLVIILLVFLVGRSRGGSGSR